MYSTLDSTEDISAMHDHKINNFEAKKLKLDPSLCYR